VKLFEKIKNILFDEEEVELPVIKKEEPTREEPIKFREPEEAFKEEKKSNVEEEISERELFESKQTFNFPAYLEEDKPKEKEEDLRRTRNLNVLDYERSKRKEKNNILKKLDKEEISKQFKPTPVISPVYGVIEFYKDNEVEITKTVTKVSKPVGAIDIDEVRSRAYGTLEDQIVSTLEKPIADFYDKKEEEIPEEKPVEELLINDLSETEQIRNDDIVTRSERNSNQDKLDLLDEIEEELDKVTPEEKKEIPVDDTIESDLFKLIDSMYENRKDEE